VLFRSDQALPHAAISLQKEPHDVDRLENLISIYMALNRFDEAEGVADKLRRLAPDVPHNCVPNAVVASEKQRKHRTRR